MNQILCGDCLEVMTCIPDNTVHLAVTSPPYNLGINYDLHNDNLAYEQYLSLMQRVWVETKRVLVPGGRFALNIAPTSIKNFRPIHHDFANQLREIGMIFRTEIIWYKQTMLKRTAWGSWKNPSNPHIVPSWEYVLVFCKDKWDLSGKPEDIDVTSEEFMRYSDGLWYIPPEPQRRGHPTPFPEELIYRLIKFYTYRGNTVLDMFGGTGTVAVVAWKTSRNFIHVDISPKYCEIAQQRLDKVQLQSALPIVSSATGVKVRPSNLRAKRPTTFAKGSKDSAAHQAPLLESTLKET
ncbi:MAG: site-specific DNA-methyltransferase [Chloroflexi bacterium]|nr:site-specific DNA-methyltransferase [Chloroflexota bacterium]MCL5076349.1 site-specific DNA-methyltransferase [Chloroflexota bacterium]